MEAVWARAASFLDTRSLCRLARVLPHAVARFEAQGTDTGLALAACRYRAVGGERPPDRWWERALAELAGAAPDLDASDGDHGVEVSGGRVTLYCYEGGLLHRHPWGSTHQGAAFLPLRYDPVPNTVLDAMVASVHGLLLHHVRVPAYAGAFAPLFQDT